MGSTSKLWVACLVLAIDGILGVWLASAAPGGLRHLLPLLFLGVLWAYIEAAQGPADARRRRIIDWHRTVFTSVGVVLALKMGFRLALELDAVSVAEVGIASRALGVLSGCLLALWGNYLPRLLSPWTRDEQPFDWQGVHRFVGWIATISGAAVAIVWLALPSSSARTASIAILITFGILALGRKLLSIAAYRSHRPLLR